MEENPPVVPERAFKIFLSLGWLGVCVWGFLPLLAGA